jgi:cytochrome c-type biogenesis protein CcmH/NrfG
VIAFALQSIVDFHFKLPALAILFAVTASWAIGRRREKHPESIRGRAATIGWSLAAVAVALVFASGARVYHAEGMRYRGRELLDRFANASGDRPAGMLSAAESEIRRAVETDPCNAGAWADLAFALQLRAFADPTVRSTLAAETLEAAQRATERAPTVPEFWIRRGVAHDMLGQTREAADSYEKSVRLAPRNAVAWYYYASHLSHDTKRRDDALRAIATCLSLDPANRAAGTLRAKLDERSSAAPFNP